MEPLAPGTEDDPLYTQVAKPSKKETAEEQALSKKAFLPSGKYGNIFELNYVQGAQHWFCKVCDCPVLGRLFNHEIGKRHTANLEKWNRTTDSSGKENEGGPDNGGPDIPVVVAPGEPVPPGFEGEVEKTTLIQERLDGFNVGPLVGLEYLLECLDYDPSKEPNYLCILCDKKGDPRTVLTHLSSYNHQVMYLQKHFPTVYRHIAPYMIKQYKRNWQSGLQKIAEAIEGTFGRLKPMQIEAGKFEKDRMYYIEIVAKGKHFSELSGHTFENVVTREELTKIHEEQKSYDSKLPFRKVVTQAVAQAMFNSKRKSPSPPVVARPVKRKPPPEIKAKRKSLSPVSDISSSDLEDFDPKNSYKPSKNLPSTDRRIPVKPKDSREAYSKRERSPVPRRRSRSPSPRRRDGPMPWQKSNYGRSTKAPIVERKRDDKTEKVEEYKKLSKAIDNDMEQVLKKHKQNPEKHPKYNDEWKKFWNARYKELQAEGKNAAAHDFKPEWIEFWNKRMLEIHQEEIKTKKAALRKRLGLPEEPTPVSFKIGERRKPSESGGRDNRPIPTAAQPDNDPEVIVIDDNDRDSSRSSSPPPTRNRRRSRSPKKRDRSPQLRRRSSPSRRDSPPARRRDSSPPHRRPTPPHRRPSPPIRRVSPALRKISPPSPVRKRSLERSREGRISPTHKRISPAPTRREKEPKFSPPPRRFSVERSPGPDRFGVRVRDRSDDRSRSREISWEVDRERDKYRDYDDKHWDRSYRGRAPPPWEGPPMWDPRDSRYPPIMDPYAPPKVLRDVTRAPVRDIDDDDDDVNIVAVLRLLTALEEKLGSLGPKVNDLLGQALAMEKKTANSSEQLLDNEMNCVMFETVKEKLKGQLLAGFVDRFQEKAFKTAIKKTASLIHVAGERKKQREVELPKKPVVVPGVGTVDKGKIARQIANALIAQGKTDVTQAELEQLINAVVGIAEAQKNSSQPVTTASFLEQIASGASFVEETIITPSKSEPETSQKDTKPSKDTKELEEDQDVSTGSQDKGVMNMEGLSDSDLQTLLQNFKDLSTEEQHGLINYLKKLEAKEPERVEKLRKFVNLTENPEEKKESGRYSPFSKRLGSLNPTSNDIKDAKEIKETEEENKTDKEEKKDNTSAFVNIDSEDEEYSFEDVAKAASQKVIEKEMEKKILEEKTKKETDDKNFSDAKALITSLMSSLTKSKAPVSSVDVNQSVPQVVAPPKTSPLGKINIISNVPVSSADLAKSLSGITMSMSSLGSILGNVQNMTKQNQSPVPDPTKPPQETPPKPKNFSPTTNPNAPLISTDKLNIDPKNPYDEFDISSQKDVRPRPEYNSNEPSTRTKPNTTYDEFNIGPNPGDFRDEMGGDQGSGRGFGPRGDLGAGPYGFQTKPLGFQERNVSPLDRNAQYPLMSKGGFRENPYPAGPSLFPNSQQFPTRGAPLNKLRPGTNNFDIRGASAGDFGVERSSRGDFAPSGGSRGDFGPDRGLRGDFGSDLGPRERGLGPDAGSRGLRGDFGTDSITRGERGLRGDLGPDPVGRGPRGDFGPDPVGRGPREEFGPDLVKRGHRGDFATDPVARGSRGDFGSDPLARGSRGDFGPDPATRGPRGDFGSDPVTRGPRGDFGPDPIARGPRDFGSDPAARGPRGDFGSDPPARGSRGDFGSDPPSRGSRGDFGPDRGDFGPDRGDFRGGIKDSRGAMKDSRSTLGDFRGTAPQGDFRGNDFRGDSRGPPGNFRGSSEDFRTIPDVRGGPGFGRGGPPAKGSLVDPSRLGNSAPSRYSSNFSGNNSFNNSYGKRW